MGQGHADDGSLPLTIAAAIDRVCDRFEGAWDAGDRPRIEDYLEGVEESGRPSLFRELLAADLARRAKLGERTEAEEYRARFPELTLLIDEVIAAAGRGVGARGGDGAHRYQVVRPHARGGLGVVFIARDHELPREVALKEIQAGLADDPASRTRFVREAEITGSLEHPGIVPVYGLGTYGDGRPYYAMRFIRGDDLKAAIAEFHADAALKADAGRRSLALRQLLRRFLDVCNAIDYAHSRGVLHRDIKPGNVIVGKYGETLVIDWGLAKPIGRESQSSAAEPFASTTAGGAAETRAGAVLGTPAYMSPEQAAGDLDRLGVHSDVYGLGATLYVLLTGRAPFEGKDKDVGAVLQAVRAGAFPSPRAIDPSIDRSLEAVCLKAMALRPEDRYPSARALGDDVERWTADEPVSARPEPLGERVRRWARHHREVVVAAAAVLLVGAIGLSVFAAVVGDKNRKLVVANSATRDAEALADDRLDRAMASIEDYYSGFSAEALKGGQLPPALRDRLLAKPRQFYEQLAAEIAARPNPSERERSLLARGRFSLGRILEILGEFGAERVQGEAALALYEDLLRRRPDSAYYQAAVGRCRGMLGLALDATGKGDEGASELKKAIAAFEALAARYPDAPDYRVELAHNHSNLAVLLASTGRPDEAAAAHKQAIAIDEALVAQFPDVPDYKRRLASDYANLGGLLGGTGRHDESASMYKKALQLCKALTERYPAVSEYQHWLAVSYGGLGNALEALGRPDEGAEAQGKLIAIYERLAAREPRVVDYQDGLGRGHANLGSVLVALGRPAEGAEPYRKAIGIFEALSAQYRGVPEYADRLAQVSTSLGYVLSTLGRPDEAEAAHREAVEAAEAAVKQNPKDPAYRNSLANSRFYLGLSLKTRGDLAEALASFRRAAEVIPPGSPLARALPGQIRDTEADLELAGRLPAVLKGEDKPRDAAEGQAFARLCYDRSHFAAAARLWAEALAADPRLADDREAQPRYNAACAAALAAAGRGKGEPALDDGAKAGLRTRARDWLGAELSSWAEAIESAPAKGRAAVARTLQHWKADPDLAAVREPASLGTLPEAERDGWRAFWSDVDALLRKAEGPRP